jgi:hypothetical protein
MDTPERKVWDERRPKDRMTLEIIFVLTITCLKTFTRGHVSVFDKYLGCPCVSVNQMIYTYTGFTCCVYTAIDTYLHNTGLYQVHITMH